MSDITDTTGRTRRLRRQAKLGATKLRDVMTQNVLTLTEDQTLREAAKALSEAGISGAPVLSGSRTVGVIASSNILDFAASVSAVPFWPLERDGLGRPSGGTQGRSTTIAFYTDLWANVEDEEVLEGLGAAPEWHALEAHTIREVMSRRLEALPPDAHVTSAINMMLASGIHRLLVMEDRELRGVVTTMALLRLLVESA